MARPKFGELVYFVQHIAAAFLCVPREKLPRPSKWRSLENVGKVTAAMWEIKGITRFLFFLWEFSL